MLLVQCCGNMSARCRVNRADGVETDLQVILSHRDEITQVFNAMVESCKTHGTSMPVNLKKENSDGKQMAQSLYRLLM